MCQSLADCISLWGGLTGKEWEQGYELAGLPVPTAKEFTDNLMSASNGWGKAYHAFIKSGAIPSYPLAKAYYEMGEGGAYSKLVIPE